ncbi:predicted protein [Naegleria gruberi]|uniref:Predicted protein n=1 Tax=Naegleria gruberi TaxID=5762 RepID=D2V5G7_NAEGR|nr:uncharacterized protein NAEGRDRAFT_46679 [Naegleria gruberi]EFC48112.1 predicted protein [Naegleria gruberi]|eukprot:XP_002680856.1 predicted protein [Naegleria gruberi strain NEG-M]
MPVIFIGGSPRVTIFFIGLFIFFQFFNQILDFYSGGPNDSSSSSYNSAGSDHYRRDLSAYSENQFDSRILNLPRKVFSIPNTRQLYKYKVSPSAMDSRQSNYFSTYLLLSPSSHQEKELNSNINNNNNINNIGKAAADISKLVIHEDTALNSTFEFVGSIIRLQLFNLKNELSRVDTEMLMKLEEANILRWELADDQLIENSKVYFTKKGSAHYRNRDCIFMVTERVDIHESDRVKTYVEARKICPQKERNRIFNLYEYGPEVTSISDTSLDEDCVMASFVNDFYEYRIICANGTLLQNGPPLLKMDKTNPRIPRMKDLHNVLALHEVKLPDNQFSVLSLKENADVIDVRNQQFHSMYDNDFKHGPLVESNTYKLINGTWEKSRIDNNLPGALTGILSRSAHRLYDVYYRGKEISYQSGDGRTTVFPAHGGCMYIYRPSGENLSVDKTTYYSFVGTGFGLYDVRSLQERYYSQDQLTLAVFESLKKRLERYNHPDFIAINHDGSYIVVVHQIVGFVFKIEGKGLALKSMLNLRIEREGSHLKYYSAPIQSLTFISDNNLAVMLDDGSISVYDVTSLDSDRKGSTYGSYFNSDYHSKNSRDEDTIWDDMFDKPVFYLVLIILVVCFVYNEFLIRKKIQAHRAAYQLARNQQQTQTTPAQ